MDVRGQRGERAVGGPRGFAVNDCQRGNKMERVKAALSVRLEKGRRLEKEAPAL